MPTNGCRTVRKLVKHSRIRMSHDHHQVATQACRRQLAPATLLWCAALLAWAWSPSPAFGQGPLLKAISGDALTQPTNSAESAAGSGAATEALEARLAEARASLATATEANGRALTNAPAGVSANDIPLRRGLLQRLVRVCEQQLSNLAELESVRRHRAELTREAQSWTGFTEPRPYSILLPDGLREELQAERLKLSNATDALSLLDQSIEENRATLKQAEGSIRQLNEQLEAAQDPAVRARLSWQRDLDQLRSQVAAATLGLLDSERQLQQERSTSSHTRIAWLQQRLVMADAGTKFTEADLEKIVARLETERRQLEEELTAAETRQRMAVRALEASRQELRGLQDQSATNPSATARATELVELRRTQLETADTSAKVLRLMLESGNTERTMWELRYAAYDTRSAGVLRQSEQRLAIMARRVELWKDYEIQHLALSSGQIAIQQARLADLNSHSDLLPLARERLATLQERDQLLLRLVRVLDRAQRLAERWNEGLQDAAGKLPFTGRLRNLFSGTRSFLASLWNFELFTALDTITVDGQPITGKRSITLGKIVLAMLDSGGRHLG